MTLFELNRLVRERLEESFPDTYWVQGEFGDASVGYGGHFYGELVQKDEQGRQIIARARVNCWARTFNLLHLRFQHETGQTLRAGIQVKLLVRITFHEQYGYSLNILDVDSAFTLGEMALRRRQILEQLESDGVLHDNQQLPLPRLLRRIAIISAQTAAGYGDFCHQLETNEYGFAFQTRLFPAVMQGRQVEQSVIAALEEIALQSEQWDAVVIIRGGGATGDLSDFDSYPLAYCITQFPLPVITGIGHERDETVLDYVAHARVKTPTAAAAYIIAHQAHEAVALDELQLRIHRNARETIQTERRRLVQQSMLLPVRFSSVIASQHTALAMMQQRIGSATAHTLQACRHTLQLIGTRLQNLDPRLQLKRGYTITTHNGKIVRNADEIRPGDELLTHTQYGEIKSKAI